MLENAASHLEAKAWRLPTMAAPAPMAADQDIEKVEKEASHVIDVEKLVI